MFGRQRNGIQICSVIQFYGCFRINILVGARCNARPECARFFREMPDDDDYDCVEKSFLFVGASPVRLF
jgi:hypothetical protein